MAASSPNNRVVEPQGKSFYAKLVEFMSSGPTCAFALAKTDAVKAWRQLAGPTNSIAARAQSPKRWLRAPWKQQLCIFAQLSS